MILLLLKVTLLLGFTLLTLAAMRRSSAALCHPSAFADSQGRC